MVWYRRCDGRRFPFQVIWLKVLLGMGAGSSPGFSALPGVRLANWIPSIKSQSASAIPTKPDLIQLEPLLERTSKLISGLHKKMKEAVNP